jgi:hypothetical protein
MMIATIMLGAGYQNDHHRCASAACSGLIGYEPGACSPRLRHLQALGLFGNRGTIPEKVRRDGGLA